jgi:hypothetical protein
MQGAGSAHFATCGLSTCTVFCHMWPVHLYRVLPDVACPPVPCIATFSRKRARLFGDKFIEHKMCVLIFLQVLSEKFLFGKEFSEVP